MCTTDRENTTGGIHHPVKGGVCIGKLICPVEVPQGEPLDNEKSGKKAKMLGSDVGRVALRPVAEKLDHPMHLNIEKLSVTGVYLQRFNQGRRSRILKRPKAILDELLLCTDQRSESFRQ